jgi:hypothetical protein
MSTAAKTEEHASQSAYLGTDSSVGSAVRQVITHLNSLALLPEEVEERKRDFKKSAISPAVRWSREVSKSGEVAGGKNGGSSHGRWVVKDSCGKSALERRTSMRRMCAPFFV